mgnify:CR=1 FL=1
MILPLTDANLFDPEGLTESEGSLTVGNGVPA